MSSDKKCPLMFALRDEGPAVCIESECAIWHKYTKSCSVLVLANTFTLFQKYGYGSKSGGGRDQGGDKGGF